MPPTKSHGGLAQMRVGQVSDLTGRMGEVDRKQRDCGMALLDRVALMLRGLSRLG
jgi:hypothetical protein